jgi:hypothetical protein
VPQDTTRRLSRLVDPLSPTVHPWLLDICWTQPSGAQPVVGPAAMQKYLIIRVILSLALPTGRSGWLRNHR